MVRCAANQRGLECNEKTIWIFCLTLRTLTSVKKIAFIHDQTITYWVATIAALFIVFLMIAMISMENYYGFLLGFLLAPLCVVIVHAENKPKKYASGSWERRFYKALDEYDPMHEGRYQQLIDNLLVVGMHERIISNWIYFERYDIEQAARQKDRGRPASLWRAMRNVS